MCGSHLIWITDYGEENIEVRRGNEEYLQKKRRGNENYRKRDLFLITIYTVSTTRNRP